MDDARIAAALARSMVHPAPGRPHGQVIPVMRGDHPSMASISDAMQSVHHAASRLHWLAQQLRAAQDRTAPSPQDIVSSGDAALMRGAVDDIVDILRQAAISLRAFQRTVI
jgi:hypothetical protein